MSSVNNNPLITLSAYLPPSTFPSTFPLGGKAPVVDSISSGGVLSPIVPSLFSPSGVTIEQYIGMQKDIAAFFNTYFTNEASDNYLNVLKGQAVLSQLPSPQQVQSTWAQDVALLQSANQMISALNQYYLTLAADANTMVTEGGVMSALYSQMLTSGYDPTYVFGSSSYNGVTSYVWNQLYNDFAALNNDYQNGSMSYQDFVGYMSQVEGYVITGTGHNQGTTFIASGNFENMLSLYNQAASAFAVYQSALNNFNTVASNPPITQSAWDNLQTAIATAAAGGTGLSYPLENLPTINFTPVTSISNVQNPFSQATFNWPNIIDYPISNANGSPEQTGVNQFIAAVHSALYSAVSASHIYLSSVNTFLTSDRASEISQLPSYSFTLHEPLVIPTEGAFNTYFIQTYVQQHAAEAAATLQLINAQQDPGGAYSDAQEALNQYKQEYANSMNSIGLTSVAGTAIVTAATGIVSNTAVTLAFNAQSRYNIAIENEYPATSTQEEAFVAATSNFLQGIIGHASHLAAAETYKQLGQIASPNASLSQSLFALNSLNSFNSVLSTQGTSQIVLTQIGQVAAGSNAPAGVVTNLATQGQIPFAYTILGQRALLTAQAAGVTNVAGFTALYLANAANSVLGSYLQQPNLTAAKIQSVIQAQNILTQNLIDTNQSTFTFLKAADSEAQTTNAFQIAAQQIPQLLQAYANPVQISAAQLSTVQAAFLTAVSQTTGPISSATALQLLTTALSTTIPGLTGSQLQTVANAIFLQFGQAQQNETLQSQNGFESSQNLTTAQATQFTQSLVGAGDANTVTESDLLDSQSASSTNFAEMLAETAVTEENSITGSLILDGTVTMIPGTSVPANTIVTPAILTPISPTVDTPTQVYMA